MLIAVLFSAIFLGLIAWNAVIAWYLKRYILEDDRVHHVMNGVFLIGNAIIIFAGISFFIMVPWQELSLSALTAEIIERFRAFLAP